MVLIYLRCPWRSYSSSKLPRLPIFLRAQEIWRCSPSSVAIQTPSHVYTYGHLLQDTVRLQNNLKKNIMSDKEPVALLASNSYEYVVGLWAIWAIGCSALPLSPNHPDIEWMYRLEVGKVKHVVVDEQCLPKLTSISKLSSSVNIIPKLIPSSDYEHAVLDCISDDTPSPHDIALVIFTSGTTAKPKGVVWTHKNLETQMSVLANAWQMSSADIVLHFLPLNHIHGIVNALLMPLFAGAHVYLKEKFNSGAIWRRVIGSIDNPITVMMGVPTMYQKLLDSFQSLSCDERILVKDSLAECRLMISGSAPLSSQTFWEWRALSGQPLLERYGMTEIGMALSNPLPFHERIPGSVGFPLPTVTVRIADDKDPIKDATLNADGSQSGQLFVRGPSVFKEYLNNPKATQDAFMDGWFKTGDFVVRDGTGRFRILGRESDILKVNGYKVSALEIECHLMNHASIRDCAVIGIEDKLHGEIPVAFVVAHDHIDKMTLSDWCKERMANYMVPKQFHIIKELPRNSMGKVDKKVLKQLIMQQ